MDERAAKALAIILGPSGLAALITSGVEYSFRSVSTLSSGHALQESAVAARIVRRNLARTGGPFLLLKTQKEVVDLGAVLGGL